MTVLHQLGGLVAVCCIALLLGCAAAGLWRLMLAVDGGVEPKRRGQ